MDKNILDQYSIYAFYFFIVLIFICYIRDVVYISGNARTGKDLNIGVANVPELDGLSGKVMDGLAASMKDKHLDLDPKDNEKMGRNLKLNKGTREDDLKEKDVGYMGNITNTCTPQVESTANEVPHDPSKITNIKEIATYVSKDIPSLELSLKQLRDAGENGIGVQERNILRHSDLSAFSRHVIQQSLKLNS